MIQAVNHRNLEKNLPEMDCKENGYYNSEKVSALHKHLIYYNIVSFN